MTDVLPHQREGGIDLRLELQKLLMPMSPSHASPRLASGAD
jgi:hypothetical protein